MRLAIYDGINNPIVEFDVDSLYTPEDVEDAYIEGRIDLLAELKENGGYDVIRADEREKVIDFILANVGFDCDNCSLRDNCGCDCKQALLKKLKEKSDE